MSEVEARLHALLIVELLTALARDDDAAEGGSAASGRTAGVA